MAKCVVCTALNMGVERDKHTNFVTIKTALLLEKRWNDVPKTEHNRYCILHGTTGNGRATGPFIKFAKEKQAAIDAAKELA